MSLTREQKEYMLNNMITSMKKSWINTLGITNVARLYKINYGGFAIAS